MSHFIPPAPSNIFITVAQVLYPLYMRTLFGDITLKVSPNLQSSFRALSGKGTIICPNHPAVLDPEVIFGLSAIVGEQFNYVAARELFGHDKSWPSIWYQKLGCYSVSRGSTNIQAIKQTVQLLKEKAKIVIFPEGEVSYQNQVLLPLETGPEHIALQALHELRENNLPDGVFILPVAIKYHYQDDIRAKLIKELIKIESHLNLKAYRQKSINRRLKRCFLKSLSSDTLGDDAMDLDTYLSNMRYEIIRQSEKFLSINLPDDFSQLRKLHFLRGVLFQMRLEKANDKSLKQQYVSILRATSLIAIGNHSFHENMTQEEVAEIINLLKRILFDQNGTRFPLEVLIDAGQIIDIGKYYDLFCLDNTKAIKQLSQALADQIKDRIAFLNKSFEPFLFKQ